MRHDSLENSIKNTEKTMNDKINDINTAIGNIKTEAAKTNSRMNMLFGVAILVGGIALAMLIF